MIGFDLSTVTDIRYGSSTVNSVWFRGTKIWPQTTPVVDWEREYLQIEAIDPVIITTMIPWNVESDTTSQTYIPQYSYDKTNWYDWTENTSVSLAPGEKVYFKGTPNNYWYEPIDDPYPLFYVWHDPGAVSLDRVKVQGNIMSLVFGDNFYGNRLSLYGYDKYFDNIFYNTTIVDASNLKLTATTLETECYMNMFNGCTLLTTPPALPATTLATYCYESMFYGCTSLTSAPALPATTLVEGCYSQMFMGCSNLVTAPILPATTLVTVCYLRMFKNCTSLNYIKCLAETWNTSYVAYWVENVAPTGTFVKNSLNTNIPINSDSGVPVNWTVVDVIDFSLDYLQTTLLSYGGMEFEIPNAVSTNECTSISYSIDKVNWTTTANVDNTTVRIQTPYYQAGTVIYWKGIATQLGRAVGGCRLNCRTAFNDTAFNLSGNIMSLLYGNNFINQTTLPSTYTFADLFVPLSSASHGCVSAENLVLPATTLTEGCYQYMFGDQGANIYLTTAPELPATTLAEKCYLGMFKGCRSLTSAPELPASTLVNMCYQSMFSGCNVLNYIKCLAINPDSAGATFEWVKNVSANGTFVKDINTYWPSPVHDDSIPSGWNVENQERDDPGPEPIDYSTQYFQTVTADSGTITLTIPSQVSTSMLSSVSYSLDDGATWTTTNNVDSQQVTITTPTLAADDVVYWKGTGTNYCKGSGSTINNYYSKFSSTCYFDAMGNILSLLYGDNFENQVLTENYAFAGLFENCGKLVNVDRLVLSDTTTNFCYHRTFASCTSLESVPQMPATTMSLRCYSEIFQDCISLNEVPVLPATTMADHCYNSMFYRCTALDHAPALPATTLATECYSNMFWRCTSLTESPILHVQTLVYMCYYEMFRNCTSLNKITCLATNISASRCLYNWTDGVGGNGTFFKDANMTSWPTGSAGIPSGWTVQDYSS